jgi:sec-independent protein translocase protein TatA
MGTTSIWHWLILGAIVVLLFGRGKVSELMGDVAKGIKSFKKGMAEDDEIVKKPGEEAVKDGKVIEHGPQAGQTTPDKTKVG